MAMMKFIVDEMTADELKDYVRKFESVIEACEDMRFAKDRLIEALARMAECVPLERDSSLSYQRRKHDLIMMEQHFISKYRNNVNPNRLTPTGEVVAERSE